jgi:DNA-binding GntR family transcriptional regulator
MSGIERNAMIQDFNLGQTNYQRVRDIIRNDIITGQFAPGSRLKITELVRRYGLSAMPIREALQQLQGEGLVVLLANKGASVRRIDEQFLWQMYEMRKALEIYFGTQLAKRALPVNIERLRTIVAEQEEAIAAAEEGRLFKLDQEFHSYIIGVSGNDEAVAVLGRCYDLTLPLRLRFGRSLPQRQRMPHDHKAIIDAISENDGARCGRLLSEHIEWAFTDLANEMRLEDDSIRRGLHEHRPLGEGTDRLG